MSSDERDIKTLWAAIAGREARLLALVKASAQIVWVIDNNGMVLSDADPPPEIADLTWSAFTGLPQESLHGRGWLSALHPDDLKTLATVDNKSRFSGVPIDTEFRVRHKSGEWRWMICRGGAVRSDSGAIMGWIGSCTDITRAKQTEAAHRDSQQRLLAALDAGEMSTWIWNVADATFWWDEAGAKLWDSLGSSATHNIHELIATLVHPDERQAAADAVAETVNTGVARSVEFRTLRTDGKLQWLSSRGRVETDASGAPVRVVGAFVDVTKLKTAEESLRQAQKMQALGTLAGGIAHDFNNLLLAISGNARLGLSETDVSTPGHRCFQEIAKASARASDLVRRILTFAARQPPAPACTALQPAISEALTLLQSSVPPNVFIRTSFAATDLSCTLAAAELQQVMVNLVNNAIHAIGTAVGSIDISVGTEPEASPNELRVAARHARIVVRDSGCGMDAATLARIFEPFFTTKPAGEGTGLGLAMVHGIVQGCGGTVTVASDVARGSAFTLLLPLASDAAQPACAPAATHSANGRGERVLYVDDDEAVNFLVQRLLEKAGYQVTCCDDPRDARRLFLERPGDFDVVVTDLTMPAMSGFDLIRELRAAGATVPFIMTSGYVREDDQARATRLGIGSIILKPDTVDQLWRELDARCAQLRIQRARVAAPHAS